MLNAQVIVIPTALTDLDITSGLDTFEPVAKLIDANGEDIPTAMLITRKPVGKLTAGQQRTLEILADLPIFESHLHSRDAFATIMTKGLLHRYYNAEESASINVLKKHVAVAMAEADSFMKDILETVGG